MFLVTFVLTLWTLFFFFLNSVLPIAARWRCWDFVSVFPYHSWKKPFHGDGVCQLKRWWMFVRRMFLCENAGGHDCAALILFRCDALLGIYQITLAYPRLWTTHAGITVSCWNSVTSKFVHYLPLPVIELLLPTELRVTLNICCAPCSVRPLAH
jgi:hypothetical protein